MRKVIYVFLIIISYSCNHIPQDVQKALKVAGKNRKELEKVFEHYQKTGEKEKLKAAYFLIANMPKKYYLWSEEFDQYQNLLIDSMKMFDSNPILFKNTKIIRYIRDNYTDSLIKTIPKSNRNLDDIKRHQYNDIEMLSADFLIQNIDLAFKAWNNPWAKEVNFENFCNYILPYRSGNEKPEMLRLFFMEMLKWLPDSMKGSNDPVRACFLINDFLAKNKFTIKSKLGMYANTFSPLFTYYTKCVGTCGDLTCLANYAMRSVGIPVSDLSVPIWGNYKTGHVFNVVLDSVNHWIYFMGTEGRPAKLESRFYTIPKLFLESFSKPDNGNNSETYDITNNFIKVTDICVDLKGIQYDENSPGYISTFDGRKWRTIYSVSINDNKALFRNMGRKIIYLPFILINNKQTPASYPIKLDTSGLVTYLNPNKTSLINIKVERTFPLSSVYPDRANELKGGRFEISNNEQFQNAKIIYTIDSVPSTFPQVIPIEKVRAKFFRFVFSKPKNDWSYSCKQVSFISSTSKEHIALQGIPIGSEDFTEEQLNIIINKGNRAFRLVPYENGLEKYTNQDKNIVLYRSSEKIWVGIKLKSPATIDAVGYSPDNKFFLEAGKRYQLFYWDKTWISLGEKVADSYILEFKGVPSNSLFRLHCLDAIREERIFTYENNELVWW